MESLVSTLRKEKVGAGHFKVSIDFMDKELSTITTNTMAIDAAFDDCYDDEDNSGRYYESREEAQESLVNEIFTNHNL